LLLKSGKLHLVVAGRDVWIKQEFSWSKKCFAEACSFGFKKLLMVLEVGGLVVWKSSLFVQRFTFCRVLTFCR